jgi:hypothetical protein
LKFTLLNASLRPSFGEFNGVNPRRSGNKSSTRQQLALSDLCNTFNFRYR